MTYNPLFDKNSPFNDLLRSYRYKVYYGGRGGAKSWTIAEALIRIADAANVRILCTRELQTSISDSVHKLLCDTIERLKMGHRFRITQNSIQSINTGSEFIFKGVRFNYREIKSLEGIDICWAEESQDMTEDSWQVILPTIRKEGSEIWVTFNTGAERDATYQRFVVNADPSCSVVHHVNYYDNQFLSETTKQEVERDRKNMNPEDFDNIWLGKPLKLTNAVIFNNRVEVKDFEVPEHAQYLFGLDFGFAADPMAAVRVFVHERVLYIDAESGGHHIELDEYDSVLREVMPNPRWRISADCALPGNISYLNRHGWNVEPAKKWPGSVEDGITHMKSYDKIVVRPSCTNVRFEFENYKWKVDATTKEILPIPIDKHNHWVDAIRYALHKYVIQKGTSPTTWKKLNT